MRRRSIVILAGVAVGAVAVAVALAPLVGRSRGPFDITATAARLDALQLAITGDVEEWQASELLNYHRVEGGVAACMKESGTPYRKAPFVSFYSGFTDADLGYGTGRVTVIDSITEHGRRMVLNEIAFARLARAGAIGDEDTAVAPDGVDALNRCSARYGHRSYRDVDPPPGAYRLSGFDDLLEIVHRDPDVRATMQAYPACMKQRYGHDVTDRSDFLFKPRLARADAPIDGQPPNTAWRTGLAEVEAVFAADVDCRLPAYRVAMKLVADGLDAWEDRHRAELDAVRAGWRKRVADAASLTA